MSSAALASQLTRRRLYAVGDAGAPRYAWGQGADPLTVYLDAQNRRWVQNPLMGNEWQRIHVMTASHPGNNLWGISGHYYADGPSHARMMSIYNVPQNKKMQGSDPSKGLHPGDEILIPGLAPPTFAAPPATPLPGAPAPGSPQIEPTPVAAPAGGGSPLDPWLAQLPPGWMPPGLPAAETPAPTPPPPPAPEQPPQLPPGIPAVQLPPNLVLTGETAPAAGAAAAPKEDEKFWTTGKVVGAAAAGVGLVGLLTWAVLAGKKKRRRRG